MVNAHALSVVHGALRPDCVFLDAEHRPRVCGFGTDDHRLATAQGDVFSFALIIYAVAAGDANPTTAEAVQALTSAKAVPEFLAKLTLQGLSPNPNERPSMEDFLEEFEDHHFAILAGADAAAVSAFAAWTEETNPNA
jgi:hypothetical protein